MPRVQYLTRRNPAIPLHMTRDPRLRPDALFLVYNKAIAPPISRPSMHFSPSQQPVFHVERHRMQLPPPITSITSSPPQPQPSPSSAPPHTHSYSSSSQPCLLCLPYDDHEHTHHASLHPPHAASSSPSLSLSPSHPFSLSHQYHLHLHSGLSRRPSWSRRRRIHRMIRQRGGGRGRYSKLHHTAKSASSIPSEANSCREGTFRSFPP